MIILSLDLLFIGDHLSKNIKIEIKKKYNINLNNILILATHTHSAPKTCEQFLDGVKIEKFFFFRSN